ncbi:hypothetical protein GH741_10985 [Aquibacillus halophilus]|uniref:Uncharacterized protein n=1 Tax=Aquibacillus halophilus TaxID=930132 RepID=A0A6A8DCD4_9BACI|nr:hypothetical protein [Aquibacillus halophilus]MRH43204.1 hypothetical protein [Aquibacillus halophilus]
MYSNQSYEQLIHQLKQQINDLNKYVDYLNQYINNKNIYEYQIQGIKIEKVKGTFQLGQLIEKELIDRDGIHRFSVGEVKITEIEDTGTVGLGVTEKGTKEKKEIITPEEATGEVKTIYENIKLLLSVENVPMFFQTLSMEEEILKKVWSIIQKKWDSSNEFMSFYETVLKLLEDITNFEETESILEHETYIILADSIEEQIKSIRVIHYLIELFLPGYFEKYKEQNTIADPVKLEFNSSSPNEQTSTQQIIDAIKSTFDLNELPESYKKLSNQPSILNYVFYSIVKPTVVSNDANKYSTTIQESLSNLPMNLSLEIEKNQLSSEQQGFLFSTLIAYLNNYQKYILLEYLLLQV